MKSVLKLGTRRSLLAWAQSSWVAREVEKLNPGVRVELVGIDTRGDLIQHIPLQKVEGKDFFVAEIDQALCSQTVDFTVHSMKDLSLTRPEELVCAAIPQRENPRDVVLFGPRALSRMKLGKTIKIGTSSPRRLENIPPFLKRALPYAPQLEFVEIRGNVNTRLSRVHESDSSDRYLDGVVLAFAGLIRLWADSEGRKELSRLLQGARWMILPLKECPAAAAQGALAIECRSQDQDVRNALAPLHHPMTAENVARERQLLEEWGGGCHQRFGATAYQEKSLGSLLYIRGVKPNNEFVEELQWDSPKSTFEGTADRISWDGSKWRSMGQTDFLDHPSLSGSHVESGSDSIFVAHSRAVDAVVLDQLKEKRVWTSGVPSWFRLAEKGIWVEGCSEGLGFESTLPTLQEAVLQLPEIKKWTVLTHEAAVNEWAQQSIPAIATYRVNLNYGIAAKQAVKKSTHLFWSSGSQFDELKEGINPDAQHACGPGKTAQHLRAAGLNPVVFPSVEEWRKWLKIQD